MFCVILVDFHSISEDSPRWRKESGVESRTMNGFFTAVGGRFFMLSIKGMKGHPPAAVKYGQRMDTQRNMDTETDWKQMDSDFS